MSYHIVLSRALNLAQIEQSARAGDCPQHLMWLLSQSLGAKVHAPGAESLLPQDYWRARILNNPECWALARRLADQFTAADTVYCTGEEIGIPLAALCSRRPNPPQIAIFVHNAFRPRVQLALKLLERRSLYLITNTRRMGEFLRQSLQLTPAQVMVLLEQVDDQFFTPGLAELGKRRPLIASVGLEKRDYRLLAQVTADLDLDVCISGSSADVDRRAATFPKTFPANMSCRFYSWTELRQLYWNADLVVVPLLKSKVTSGITTMLEAMACRRPVIASRTIGLEDYFQIPGALVTVEPEDDQSLRQAITHLLNNQTEAKEIAERGYAVYQQYFNSQNYLAQLTHYLQSLHSSSKLIASKT